MAKIKDISINIEMEDPNRDILLSNKVVLNEFMNFLKKQYVGYLVNFDEPSALAIRHAMSDLKTSSENWQAEQDEKAPSEIKEVINEIVEN